MSDRVSVSPITDDMVQRVVGEALDEWHRHQDHVACDEYPVGKHPTFEQMVADSLSAALAGCTVARLPEALEHNERGATWIANKGHETEMGYTAFLHWSDNSPTVETDFAEWGTEELRAQCLAGLAACDFADRLAAEQSCAHDPDRVENDEVAADEHERLCEPGSQVGDQ